MKKAPLLALSAMIALGAVSTAAEAGCGKGALAGAVAGHFLGHHGVAGAAAGCAVGHYHSKHKALKATHVAKR